MPNHQRAGHGRTVLSLLSLVACASLSVGVSASTPEAAAEFVAEAEARLETLGQHSERMSWVYNT